MDPITILSITAAVVGVAAGIVQVIDYIQKNRKNAVSKNPPTYLPHNSENIDTSRDNSSIYFSGASVISTFSFTRERIFARVHRDFVSGHSSELLAAFEELNNRRQANGLEGYYDAQRFRPIGPPKVVANSLLIELTPFNYSMVALMKDEETSNEIKKIIKQDTNRLLKQLPRDLANMSYLKAQGYNLIGTETCLVTSDGKTLLRRRGRHVLRGNEKWDVSVSGHPSSSDIVDNMVDFARTIQRETQSEIGNIMGDPRNIVFLGIVALHPDKVLGDMNIVAVWPIENSSKEVRELITNVREDGKLTFKTTIKSRESYVWDTDNMLVDFDGPVILEAIQNAGFTINDFVAEAAIGLELALRSHNRRPLGVTSLP